MEPITVARLIDAARSLRSDDGENDEYDRALRELAADLLGIPQDLSHLTGI